MPKCINNKTEISSFFQGRGGRVLKKAQVKIWFWIFSFSIYVVIQIKSSFPTAFNHRCVIFSAPLI